MELDSSSSNLSGRALLSTADVDFIQGFSDSLREEIANNRDHGGLLTAVLHRVTHFQEDVICATTTALRDTDTLSWNPLVCTRDDLTIRITGLAPDDRFQVTAASSKEASETVRYVSALDAACRRLKRIQDRCVEVSEKQQELHKEQASLRQPAETTVDEHIRLLRQYNKTKDVGQQLIGLIAESRGVPVGTLYRDGDYGVSTDD